MFSLNHQEVYEVVYENQPFRNLQWVREDQICETRYITMKNYMTGELFTFEEQRVNELKKQQNKLKKGG